TTSSISVSPNSTTSYTVTATDNGQTSSAVATVTIGTTLTINVNSTTVCSGNNATLTASGADTYIWSNNETGSSITVSPNSTTSYTVTGTSNGCVGTAVGSVTIGNSLLISVNSATICVGTEATLTATGADNYSWSNNENGNSIQVSPTATTSYTVTGTSNGCSGTAIATVNIGTTLNISVNSPTTCLGNNVTLTATGADTYKWSTNETGESIIVSPGFTTSYTVTGTSNGCTGTAIATVTIGNTLGVEVNSPTLCPGGQATLTATGGDSYIWSTGETTNSITVLPLSTSTYTVTGISNGCSGTAVSTVTYTANPSISVNSATIAPGTSATLTATGADNYSWNTGQTSSSIVVSPAVTTTYTVTGTFSGCSAAAVSVVTIDAAVSDIKCVDLFVPNAFSPNNDGVNDIELVLGNCISKMQFMIFDRWGEKVFESNNPKDSWDGKYNGELMNTAVFVYYLKATLTNGEEIIQKGNISLVR
ncbi:MAG: hypothetical protein K0S44_2287, partial [Bacteroidetes bacterium]|nr:hypothetical protein [Bacteroidota bacterium]